MNDISISILENRMRSGLEALAESWVLEGLLKSYTLSSFDWENDQAAQAYSVQLLCKLNNKLEKEIDEISLILSFEDLNQPQFYELELSWGFPSAYVEYLYNQDNRNEGDSLLVFSNELAQMQALLKKAILRSYPKDDYGFRNRNGYR